MARIRTVKPSFWGDDRVSQLSRDARLLFLGLISMADDQGRFLASVASITGYIYPHDSDVPPVKIRKWLAEITDQELILLYNGGRAKYGAIRKWKRHQRISKPQPSSLPPPPDATLFPE